MAALPVGNIPGTVSTAPPANAGNSNQSTDISTLDSTSACPHLRRSAASSVPMDIDVNGIVNANDNVDMNMHIEDTALPKTAFDVDVEHNGAMMRWSDGADQWLSPTRERDATFETPTFAPTLTARSKQHRKTSSSICSSTPTSTSTSQHQLQPIHSS